MRREKVVPNQSCYHVVNSLCRVADEPATSIESENWFLRVCFAMQLDEPINFNDLFTKSNVFKIDEEQAIERNDEENLLDDNKTAM